MYRFIDVPQHKYKTFQISNHFRLNIYVEMWFVLAGVLAVASLGAACTPSITTVSGTHAPVTVCSGALIFADDFDNLDLLKWQHEITLAGGGNWEFQGYTNNRSNSYAHSGRLFIRPTLTSDQFGEHFLTSGHWSVEGGTPAERCTNPTDFGCSRTGNSVNILNPIKSARLRTVNSFNFRYGRLEISAKLPAGDWLWPALWLMPSKNAYGTWPASGEIDLMESRGNRDMYFHGAHIGVQEAGSTMHFGPYPPLNGFERAHWVRRNPGGYNNGFHRYQMEWTPDFIRFSIDNELVGHIDPGNGGFWEYGGFGHNRNIENPWRYGSKMAPFDQEFFILINVAVGGTNGFFPDGVNNPSPKPWWNQSPTAPRDFWNARGQWLPTWNMQRNNGEDSAMQVDYVRVWSI